MLAFDWDLRVEDIRSLSKRKSVFEREPHFLLHLLLSEAKIRANQSVNDFFKTVKTLLFRHLSIFKNEAGRLLAFSHDHFGAQNSRDYEKQFYLTDQRFIITPHCLQRSGATRDFMVTRLSKHTWKDRGRWKNHTTLYTYVQCARLLIVQEAVVPNGRKLLDEIIKNIAKLPSVLEVPTGWAKTLSES